MTLHGYDTGLKLSVLNIHVHVIMNTNLISVPDVVRV